jgi:pimeloyl-ACP methyl ester carboxylesterase
MANFDSFDGLTLYYDDQGDGPTVVLLHGFAADMNVNYVRSGILDLLLDEGYRVVALDARGHGLSSKPTDPAAYADDAMKRDVVALFDHLGLDDVVLVGYSMGAHLSLRLVPDEPRVKAVVLLGIGESAAGDENGPDRRDALLAVLEADSPDDVDDASLRQFRVMAGLDREPLLAYIKAPTANGPAEPLGAVSVPVLLIVGDDDENAGDPTGLAEKLGATLVRVPGDHFTANSRPELHRALLGFVAEHA